MVTGCYIGTDPTGVQPAPNTLGGIEISGGAHANTVGGPKPTDRNVIAGNTGTGVLISGPGSDGNVIVGNLIGLAAGGINTLGNGSVGLQIAAGAKSNTIGGTDPGSRNFISGNVSHGIVITGSGTNSNVVVGNTIGGFKAVSAPAPASCLAAADSCEGACGGSAGACFCDAACVDNGDCFQVFGGARG